MYDFENELVFDRTNYKTLKYIKRHGQVTLLELSNKFKDKLKLDFLGALYYADYVCIKDCKNNPLPKEDLVPHINNFACWNIEPKGNEYLRKRLIKLWKWLIPIIVTLSLGIIGFLFFS